MRTIVIIIIILVVIGIALAVYFYMRKPKVGFENIDYLAKTVQYKMSAGGCNFTGTKSYNDKATTEKTCGKYRMVASAEGSGFILAIFQDGKIVKGLKIDLTTQQNTELGPDTIAG